MKLYNFPVGTIIFTSSKSGVNKVTRFFQKSKWEDRSYIATHSAWLKPKHGMYYAEEADGTDTWGEPGVYEVLLSDHLLFKPDSNMIFAVPDRPFTDEEIIRFYEFLDKQIGKPYDYRNIFFQGLRFVKIRIRKCLGLKEKDRSIDARSNKKAMEKFQCWELIGCTLNWLLNCFPKWKYTSPMDGLVWCENNNFKFYKFLKDRNGNINIDCELVRTLIK